MISLLIAAVVAGYIAVGLLTTSALSYIWRNQDNDGLPAMMGMFWPMALLLLPFLLLILLFLKAQEIGRYR